MTPNMQDRGTMVASFPHGGTVAEVGVQIGDFADTILRVNQPRELYLIDCWEHQSVLDYGHDPANECQERQTGKMEHTTARFAHLPNVKIMRSYSVPAAASFADEFFDWVYLDANHLRLRADLEAWLPKIKHGGWLSGHDYCIHDDYINVQPVMDHFVREIGAKLYVVETEEFPSWCFLKE